MGLVFLLFTIMQRFFFEVLHMVQSFATTALKNYEAKMRKNILLMIVILKIMLKYNIDDCKQKVK